MVENPFKEGVKLVVSGIETNYCIIQPNASEGLESSSDETLEGFRFDLSGAKRLENVNRDLELKVAFRETCQRCPVLRGEIPGLNCSGVLNERQATADSNTMMGWGEWKQQLQQAHTPCSVKILENR